MRNRKTCAELLMKLRVRLRIGGNIYERRRGEKKNWSWKDAKRTMDEMYTENVLLGNAGTGIHMRKSQAQQDCIYVLCVWCV